MNHITEDEFQRARLIILEKLRVRLAEEPVEAAVSPADQVQILSIAGGTHSPTRKDPILADRFDPLTLFS